MTTVRHRQLRFQVSNFSNTITLKPNSDNKNSASYVMTSPVECYANEKESSLVAGGIRGLYALTVKNG